MTAAFRLRRVGVISILCAGLLLLFTGCGQDHARLRLVHASPDAGNVDFLVDGKSVLTDVPYTNASDYLTVQAGTRRIEVRATGTSTDLINSTISFSSHSDSTVLAEGLATASPSTIGAVNLTDDNSDPASGKAKVRVVHAAPSSGNVDVYIVPPGTNITTVSPTLTDMSFQAASAYQSVDPATYEVVVTPAGVNTIVLIDFPDFAIAAGQIRSTVTMDAGGGGSPFQLFVLNDKN